jgi:phenylpyruvate tautomerase PptA (4-oxalocrotonate tautomerase family)
VLRLPWRPHATVDHIGGLHIKRRQLAKDITKAFTKPGISPDNINIIMRENPKSCWAVKGKLCSDFKIPEGA